VKAILIGTIVIVLLGGALVSMRFTLVAKKGTVTSADAPYFVGTCYGPRETLSGFIEDQGGLPKEDYDLLAMPESTAIHPVKRWRVDDIEVRRTSSALGSILDDDPTYQIAADIHVAYTDGSKGHLRWDAWRYGRVLGPIVICRGDGPPGRIIIRD
jgi:hypothetical protein